MDHDTKKNPYQNVIKKQWSREMFLLVTDRVARIWDHYEWIRLIMYQRL